MNGTRTSSNRQGAAGVAGIDGAGVSLDEPLLDCEAAAVLLDVRVSWVRDAARQGHLPSLRVGRHLRFTRVMLEDWLVGQFGSPSAPTRTHPTPVSRPGSRSSRGAFRRSTQAALLASLAENSRDREVDDER